MICANCKIIDELYRNKSALIVNSPQLTLIITDGLDKNSKISYKRRAKRLGSFSLVLVMKSSIILFVVCAVSSAARRNATQQFQAIKPRPFFITDDDCFDDPTLEIAPHIDCTKYWMCDEFGAFEVECENGQIFDNVELFCGGKSDKLKRGKFKNYFKFGR